MLVASAMSRIGVVTDDESVARHIAKMTRRKSWRDEIKRSWDPQPIRWLMEALMAARLNGDILLFSRLLSWWVREILGSALYAQVRKEAGSVVLSGGDTDYMVALDRHIIAVPRTYPRRGNASGVQPAVQQLAQLASSLQQD